MFRRGSRATIAGGGAAALALGAVVWAGASSVSAAACAPPPAAAAAARGSGNGPQLVVVITIDQLRSDYLDRFRPNLTGGLLRFRDQGAFFVEGRQDHAITSTAPGHSTILSGRVPARTNILSNDYGVPDPARWLIADAQGSGASPWRFRGTTLYDWMRVADPETRMVSVSRKDRGAILPAGAARTNVFWWDTERFTTSSYYRDTLPTWVSNWNSCLDPDDWKRRTWDLVLPESAYPEPDDQPWEAVGNSRGNVFPHVMASVESMRLFPWMDSLTLDLALTGARHLELGRRGSRDILAVSLSTLDEIGHVFGPDSREVHDLVVRIDRWLDMFMRELEQHVPPANIVWVLTSDHGVVSMPELLQSQGVEDAGRVSVAALMRRTVAPLQQRFEHRFGFEIQSGVALADTAALTARGIDVDALGDSLATLFAAVPGIRRTWTPRTLAAAPADDESARLWRRSIPPSYGWIALAEAGEQWTMTSSRQASHGWPSAQNHNVPIVFMGHGIPAERFSRVVRTVDIAPTLAALLGVHPTERLDGEPLPEVVTRAQ